MSVLYGTSFQYPDVELRKNQDLVDSNPHSYYDNQQQNHHSSGLMWYRSAPSSLFDTLVNGSNVVVVGGGGGGGGVGGTGGGEEYRFLRSLSPEIDTILERFMSPSGNSSGGSDPHDVPAAAIKQEMTEPAMVFQRNFQLENSGSVNGGSALDRPFPTKMGCSGNGSNLARQSSSPADFFSNLRVENGFSVIRDSGSYKLCGEASPRPSRLSNQLSFSSGPRYRAQISETAVENTGVTSSDGTSQNRKRQYMPNFQNDTWDDSSFNGLKRSRENDSKMFSVFNDLEHQDSNPANHMKGLTHHLSLPKTVAEMATVEKFLQFQSSVPCKIRAKRGFATHPRSIAERVRRTRISERMRKLQELFPNMDKQTNTADMLELAVESIKDLQSQVKALSDTKARCKCSSIHKPYSSASSA